ncbi:hypothetical protein PG2113B_1076 [Bifidobacterium pseudolongum subsp. globosum]|nr:hypothetical protein PG2113B_1076 [Bifidobacterium pseudolongum subsp. globosum]RYQ09698.1 hypothetical protein PG2098B_1076 [Bifidobacterium pseudolongum subsp. globosum]RYQ12862.1 hypothetical protein PG2088B_1080 [Bifidobacterium pseudolongum subsp. globosum]RYQ15529.1 hypothetical protein PG2086B_1077 [Bifidobacterium pseudolongum subsp. globosum]
MQQACLHAHIMGMRPPTTGTEHGIQVSPL